MKVSELFFPKELQHLLVLVPIKEINPNAIHPSKIIKHKEKIIIIIIESKL